MWQQQRQQQRGVHHVGVRVLALPCHADGVVSPRGGARVDHKKKERERKVWQEKGDAGTGHPFVVLPQPTPQHPPTHMTSK